MTSAHSAESRAAMAPADMDPGAYHHELRSLVWWMDNDLDSAVAETYQDQPLAQDWARVSKVAEETGEAIDALIGLTGQNPRKGHYGSHVDLYAELCDVALTALYALQHFTKDSHDTMTLLMSRARYHHARRSAQIDGEQS